jgi:phosphatidylserine/phosphatidylglycerophosphate/cardiolipin synthase-like enzyme
MGEANPPDIVVVMPRSAEGWLEQKAMDAARVQLARAIGKVDKGDSFRIYVPVTKGGTDIYVHAKLMIVDDRILRIGSANLNNRSLGLDSECDMVLDCALPANKGSEKVIAELRTRLLAEHLGVMKRLSRKHLLDPDRWSTRWRRCAGRARRSNCSTLKSRVRSTS